MGSHPALRAVGAFTNAAANAAMDLAIGGDCVAQGGVAARTSSLGGDQIRSCDSPPTLAGKLFFPVREDDAPSILEVLSRGVRDPKTRYMPDRQDLMFFAAARSRKLGGPATATIARRLRDLGVPGNSVDRLQQTALFFAAREGNHECAMFLVDQKCDVNHCDINGQSALFYAVRESRVNMCKVLIQLGASLDLPDKTKNTARTYAKLMNIESALVEATCDPGSAAVSGSGHPDPNGRKALHVTAKVTAAAEKRAAARISRGSRAAGNGVAAAQVPTPSPKPKRRRLSLGVAACEAATARQPRRRKLACVTMASWSTEGGPDDFLPAAAPEPEAVLAHAGEYYVCAPSLGDVSRLRWLEREFVHDHYEVFRHELWRENCSPSDWCQFVNVIEDEDKAQQAIASIVLGKTPGHDTLQCVHVPPRPPLSTGRQAPPPRVVGYVHVVYTGGHLDISHLKVDREHQRRGLGSLLLAGAAQRAERVGNCVDDLQLVVCMRNQPAVSLYHSLGFKDMCSVRTRVHVGGPHTEWMKMTRPLPSGMPFRASVEAFARICEARAAAAHEAAQVA